jgi:hypothetical protein
MIQKKKAGRPAAKKVIEKPITAKVETNENQFPEVEKIETVEVEKPSKAEKIKPLKKRRNLHPVEVNGVVRMLTKFAYNSIKKDRTTEIILPKNSPFNQLEDCEGC